MMAQGCPQQSARFTTHSQDQQPVNGGSYITCCEQLFRGVCGLREAEDVTWGEHPACALRQPLRWVPSGFPRVA